MNSLARGLLWLFLVFAIIVLAERFFPIYPLLLWLLLGFMLYWAVRVGTGNDRSSGSIGAEESPAGPEDRISPATMAQYAESLAPHLEVQGWRAQGPMLEFDGRLHRDAASTLAACQALFQPHGLTPLLLPGKGNTISLVLLPDRPGATKDQPSAPRWWLHWLLFGLTFLTTTWAGALHQGVNLLAEPARFLIGVPYSLGLLLILGAHELGHYFAAKRHGVAVTPPYFVPVPFGLGTFEAFIRIKGLAEHRRATFDVAAAGPLAGLVFALPALWLGLTWSQVVPGGSLGVNAGSSVLLTLLAKFALGAELSQGHMLVLHPLAQAGWIGLMVTALNLLPIGQLDGGHIAHALVGPRRSHTLSVAGLAALAMLGLFVWPQLLSWAFIVYLIAGTHDVPSRDDVTSVGTGRKLIGLAVFVLLVLILLPVPSGFYRPIGVHSPYF